MDPSESLTQSLFPQETDAERIERIDKPFGGFDDVKRENAATEIARIYSQENNVELFKQAALSLSNVYSRKWEGMRASDREAILQEKKMSFMDQPLPLKTTYFMLFTAAIVQGWSQTGTNAANLEWPTDLLRYQNATSPGQDSCGPREEHLWIYAGVNAAPYFAASLEKFAGRRPAIMMSALFVFIAAIGSACANTWGVLLGFRVLLGLGMGCKAAVVPVFMAEIAPAHLRGMCIATLELAALVKISGRLVMNWQVFDTLGILFGFAANVAISKLVSSPHMVWRWQVASLCIPSFALLCGVIFIPWDSPRFLMKREEARKERWRMMKQAVDSGTPIGIWNSLKLCFMPSVALPYRSPTVETFRLLRGELILAYKEILLIHCQLILADEFFKDGKKMDRSTSSNIHSLPPRSQWLEKLWSLWRVPIIHREAKAAAMVMLSQQLCGINVLIFYSASLFCRADSNSNSADSTIPLVLSLLLGLFNFFCALPAYRWIENHGRRWLLLFTIPFMVVWMLAAAASFHVTDNHSRLVRVAIFTSLFTIFYSPGLGPVPFTYSSEVFSLEQRMVGMSFAVFINFFFAGLFTLFVPRIAETSLGNAGLLGIFAGLNVLAFILVWRYVPELVGPPVDASGEAATRSKRQPRTLEQLYTIFNEPMETYRNYHWDVYVPHVWNCWLHTFKHFPPWKKLPVAPDQDYFAWLRNRSPR